MPDVDDGAVVGAVYGGGPYFELNTEADIDTIYTVPFQVTIVEEAMNPPTNWRFLR